MNRSDILRALFRPSLANLIEARGGMTDDDLLGAVFQFAPDHDTLMTLTAAVRDGASDPVVAAWASDILAWQDNLLREFGKSEPGVVYEVHVKITPASWDESCLCATYEGALSAIRHMIGEYDDICPENPDSRYRVVRRHILTDGEAAVWGGDTDCGEAVFLPGVKLYRLDMYVEAGDRWSQERECNHECMDCDQEHQILSAECREVVFPTDEFPHITPALWTDPRTAVRRYAAVWQWPDSDGSASGCAAELYTIPLDTDYVRLRRFETDDFTDHQHIEPPFIEPVDPSVLTPEMRADYEALVSCLKKWEEPR
ncbi:MAG: hypothetical protein MJ192_08030 [Clostridia bacterium]|nr:hypothetical protein [Clostridia bacterium]